MGDSQHTGRDIAVIVAGIAAGILGSRLLPPLISQMTAARRTQGGRDPFELLSDDHRKISALLDDMVAHSNDSAMRRSSSFIMLKRKLAKHALAEEDVVYPLLHGKGGDPEASKHLYDEHADMKILLYELEERLKRGDDWHEPATRLRTIIQSHIDEEEQVVFPLLRERIAQEKLPAVSGQISREEALVL